MYPVPLLVWIVVLTYAAAMVLLPARAVTRGGERPAAVAVGIVLGAAMVVSGYAAWRGAYRQAESDPIAWIGIPLVGLLLALVAGASLPAVRRGLADPEAPVRLALPQAFRIAGFVFLLLMVTGDLPAVFALPAGLGDIAVGVGAVLLVRRPNRRGLVWLNVLGLLDLVVAVSIGVTSAPGLLHALPVTPTTDAMTLLPLALIPSVGVPIMAALHIESLRRLG